MSLQSDRDFSFQERIADVIFPAVRERRVSLEREAAVDALTGLANRAAFDKARASAEADPLVSFIVFDCNNFGLVNKTLGHAYGDEILSFFASEIKRACAAMRARAFRYGGDEFVVITTVARARFLRDAIENKTGEFDFGSFTVTVSGEVGATLIDADSVLQKRKNARKAG